MQQQDRVALTQRPELVGRIESIDRRDIAEITFEGGGRGRFPVAELQKVPEDTPANKSWPPSGLETKAAL